MLHLWVQNSRKYVIATVNFEWACNFNYTKPETLKFLCMAKLKFYSANGKGSPKLLETCNYNYTEPAANQNFQMAYFCSNCFNYTTHHSSTAFCCPWCAHNYTKVKLSHFRHANWQLPSCW